jgi:hypothetical protein
MSVQGVELTENRLSFLPGLMTSHRGRNASLRGLVLHNHLGEGR